MKEFNTTAVCIPEKHYMVDISETVGKIKAMVDAGKYFTINRARQYGKTTTLYALGKRLENEYLVLSLDFQGISHEGFSTESNFVRSFSRLIKRKKKSITDIPEVIDEKLEKYFAQEVKADLGDLFDLLSTWCEISPRSIVLIIDEVDSASNNQVFLDFLAMLRDGYISREADGMAMFQSVILAGVTDIRNLKAKIRDDENAKKNSPWNIAVDFTIDMSLSEAGIRGMLDEYEADHGTGMDSDSIARLLRDYTNGYPFLVSRLCQLIDTEVAEKTGVKDAWTRQGVEEAVKLILAEDNTLFQSLATKLNNYPKLKQSLRGILMEGAKLTYSPDQQDIVQMLMYGFIRRDNNTIKIDNRIFETRLYNLFITDEEMNNNIFSREGSLARNRFVEDNRLNMRKILKGFIATYIQVFGPLEERFKEKDGRELFLLYLKPIINGTGNYYIEAQTRDQTRTDVVVDYLGQQYIIELKIWRGDRYNTEGEKQISEYLDYFGLSTGYMLSFNFNKKKETGVRVVHIGEKTLYEGTL